jgi:hypothetical protein
MPLTLVGDTEYWTDETWPQLNHAESRHLDLSMAYCELKYAKEISIRVDNSYWTRSQFSLHAIYQNRNNCGCTRTHHECLRKGTGTDSRTSRTDSHTLLRGRERVVSNRRRWLSWWLRNPYHIYFSSSHQHWPAQHTWSNKGGGQSHLPRELKRTTTNGV